MAVAGARQATWSVSVDGSSDVEFEMSEEGEVTPDFNQMGLNPNVLKKIHDYGFQKPWPIQQMAIKPIMEGRNVIAHGPSGCGKTATLSISILARLNIGHVRPQALVLSPTKELAVKIQKVCSSLLSNPGNCF